MIRVVVIDDSPFVCRLLTSHLQSSPDLRVVGMALHGERAVEMVKELRPDAVTLDLEMPRMNGLEVLERIMRECPTPVILVSGVSRRAAAISLQALDLGAVDFILKYTPWVDTNPELLRQEIIAKVRAASQIRVIRSLQVGEQNNFAGSGHLNLETRPAANSGALRLAASVVVIGASTGGPLAVRELLSELPAEFGAAIIIVQHMPATFTRVLAAQLNNQVAIRVKEAEDGDRLSPGVALVAPGGYHLLLRPDARVRLTRGPEIGGHCPSIDLTMQSVAQHFGSRATGVVLTGMGNDGSMGLVAIRARGGRTFAQEAASCVVNGMPQRAIERGVVDQVASPAKIGQWLAASQPRAAQEKL